MKKEKVIAVYSEGKRLLSHCSKKRAMQMVSRKKAKWIGHNEVILLINKEKERKIRNEVLERDNYSCVYCGVKLNKETATIDHVIPRSRGGSDYGDNLVCCCRPCNEDKANYTYEEYFLIVLLRIINYKEGYKVEI